MKDTCDVCGCEVDAALIVPVYSQDEKGNIVESVDVCEDCELELRELGDPRAYKDES